MRLRELAVLHPGECLQRISRAAAFVHAHVELRTRKGAFYAAEKDGYLVGSHAGRSRDEFVAVVEGIEIEQMVLA